MKWKDLNNETQAHIEEKALDLMEAGVPKQEAWARARREFGNSTLTVETSREVWGWMWLERAWQDVVFAKRMLVKNPAFTTVAVLSLAIGIGANCAMFSLADAMLLRPLPVPEPEELITVGSQHAFISGRSARMSYPDLRDLRARSQSFENLAAFSNTSVRYAPSAEATTEVRMGQIVTGNYFATVRVKPELGRVFSADEDQVPGRDAVVVLSHKFWLQQFAGDASALGRAVRMNGIDFQVIGVMAADFTGTDQWLQPEFYLPVMMWPRLLRGGGNPLEERELRALEVKARLKPGVSLSLASAEAAVIGAALEKEFPDANRSQRIVVRTELQERTSQSPPMAALVVMVLVLAAAVLLVACTNVAGLLASRAPVRAREISVRLALGSGRTRLIRQLFTESLMLALLGAAGGIGLGFVGVRFLKGISEIPTDAPVVLAFELNERTLLYSVGAAIASVLLFGFAPVVRAVRTNLANTLRTTSPQAPKQRLWTRNLLVAGQVAVSMVLLTVGAFMYLSFRTELAAGPGFRIDHLLLMTFDPSLAQYNAAQTREFYRNVVERAKSVPGVRSAALTSNPPMGYYGITSLPMRPEGYQFPPGQESAVVRSAYVDENFFDTLQLPIAQGRRFTVADGPGAPLVAVVNDTMARRYWPGRSAVGKRFRLRDGNGPWVEVAGVAKTAKYNWMLEAPQEFVYFPYRQHASGRMVLVAEAAGAASSIAPGLREMTRALDASQFVSDVRTLKDQIEMGQVNPNRMVIQMIGGMGGMGVALALTGLYGLMTYAVSTRSREIGVRVAIGARKIDVIGMVLRQGLKLAGAGTVVGILLSIGADRLMASAFPGQSHPLIAYLLVIPSVFAVTMLAAYIPARRASMVDPVSALRQD